MRPQAILDDLAACGIAPRLTPDGRGIALPAGQLNPAQRAAIVANKAALIEFLRSADQVQKPAPTAPQTASPACPPAPAKPLPHFHLDQPWRISDRAYERHHWKCSVCKAAARGHSERCAAGQHLRDNCTSEGHRHD